MNRGIGRLLVIASMSWITGPVPAQTLYKYSGATLFDGAYGPIALVQRRASEELAACGSSKQLTADGKFGADTREALRELAKCPKFVATLAGDTAAKNGEITSLYWTQLIGSAAPGLDERARTIMLTYEATDYTRAEWNFCQSKPLYDPSIGKNICYSNDPKSYITWGPNGATGGGGREVQLILATIDRDDPALFSRSFGDEAAAVRRTFDLPDRTPKRELETYLCGIWATPLRRQAWRQGFAILGREAKTRATFDRLYQSQTLDGGKIAAFYNVYAANNLTPTEVDYAFFKDRAAHTSPDKSAIDRAIKAAIASGKMAPWQIRRSIALSVRPTNQRDDRLGRDIAFIVDGSKLEGLSVEEQRAWKDRGPLRASDAGLSDDRKGPHFRPGPAINNTVQSPATLTAAEISACPAAVLATVKPGS